MGCPHNLFIIIKFVYLPVYVRAHIRVCGGTHMEVSVQLE